MVQQGLPRIRLTLLPQGSPVSFHCLDRTETNAIQHFRLNSPSSIHFVANEKLLNPFNNVNSHYIALREYNYKVIY
ncbi:hypothetical protein B9D94_22860 [Paenibacillus sp. Cedars]|nr:hypothetical protein B9D94_22860 [Paenibacillus sp. Cedars]